MQKEVILYEDERSLFSGKEGLDLIKEIISESKNLLKKNGFVLLEIDECEFHKNEISDFLIKMKIFKFFFEKDDFDKNRFIIFFP
jgi:methylase of polypeptide subunit release factors